MNRITAFSAALFLMCISAPFGQTTLRRCRGEGLYSSESSNTPAHGSIWASGQGTLFLWDATSTDQVSQPMPNGFLKIKFESGLFDFSALRIESQILSALHGKDIKFGGNIRAAAKLTIPNNKDIRLIGAGLEIAALYSFFGDNDFNSLGGYRLGGTGFSPAGLIVEGLSLEAKALADLDLIPLITWLPLKMILNAGARLPLNSNYSSELTQYLVSAGIAYSGVNVDVFVEYSLEALVNDNTQPKMMTFVPGRKWEVAFSENPMYLTPGGRMRYPSGLSFFFCVPILLSYNSGSTMEHSGEDLAAFPNELERGIDNGFDPWFAKWKIVFQLSYPLRYTESAAEMRRNFLLLKNRKETKRIDIDERLKTQESQPAPEEKQLQENSEEDDKQRLEKIRKKRNEIEGSN